MHDRTAERTTRREVVGELGVALRDLVDAAARTEVPREVVGELGVALRDLVDAAARTEVPDAGVAAVAVVARELTARLRADGRGLREDPPAPHHSQARGGPLQEGRTARAARSRRRWRGATPLTAGPPAGSPWARPTRGRPVWCTAASSPRCSTTSSPGPCAPPRAAD